MIPLFLSKVVTLRVAPPPSIHCRRHPEKRKRHAGMHLMAEGRGRRFDPDWRETEEEEEEEEWLEWRNI